MHAAPHEDRRSPEPVTEPRSTTVDAFELLEQSEPLWRHDPVAALRCDGSADSMHRRKLVLEALRAYDRLRLTQAPDADPLTVFLRWPTCTLVSLAALAANSSPEGFRSELRKFLTDLSNIATTSVEDVWLRGWERSWWDVVDSFVSDNHTESAFEIITHGIPGLSLMLSVTGIAGRESEPPSLALDIERGVVVVRVPDGLERAWTVRAGERPCHAVSGSWVVPSPTTLIECRSLTGISHRLTVVNTEDPLLVFDLEGTLLTEKQLSTREVWLLHPGTLPLEAFAGDPHVLEEATPPLGWSGWTRTRVALDQVTAFRSVISGQQARFGPWRHLGGHSTRSTAFEFGTALPVLTDLDGNPVYASPPRLTIEGSSRGQWRIDIRSEDGMAASTCVNFDDLPTVLTDLLPQPALGRFHVSVHDSDDRQVQTAFTFAEGLSVSPSRQARLFDQDGTLVGANVRISATKTLVSPGSVHLSRRDMHKDITICADDCKRALRLRVSIPHAAVRKRVGHQNGEWEINPVTFTADELRTSAALDLHLPTGVLHAIGATPPVIACDEQNNPVQYVTGRSYGTFIRYGLSQLNDDLPTNHTLRIWLDLPTDRAHISTIVTPPPASDVVNDGESLRLIGRSGGPLTVTVHSVYTPWEAPHTTPLPEGCDEIHLQHPFRNGGPLIVTVLPAGAELPDGWPYHGQLPRSGVVRRVGDRDQVPALADPAAQQVALYLAGQGPLPHAPAALPLLWIAAVRGGEHPDSALGRATAHECAIQLGQTPGPSLFAAGATQLPDHDMIVTLIRSGLASHPFRHVDTPSRVRALWQEAPLPSLLLSSPLLPYLSGSPLWDHAELEPDEVHVLDTVRQHCSAVALDVLAGRRPVPSGLHSPLAADASVTPQVPVTPLLAELSEDLAERLDELREFASTSHRDDVLSFLVQRWKSHDDHNALVPTLSLGLALIARLAAQGDRAAALVDRQMRSAWVEIAMHAPDLAAADLALAEFIVAAQIAQDG